MRRRMRAVAENTVSLSAAGARDEELLVRAQKGEYDAVGFLFDRYSGLIFGIGLRILRDRGEAEDLVQDLFLRLIEKTNAFDPIKGCARTWIVQFAYRRAFDRRSYLERRSFYSGTNMERLKNAFQERQVEEQVAARVTGEQLRAAFQELSERQRATLEMFFFEGCSLREASARLGESLENTRHFYYRGLERLRRTATAISPGKRSYSDDCRSQDPIRL
jgi:RNA polymerase sigma-70 factor, ECF subfamily